MGARPRLALGALGTVTLVTAAWWALALWPAAADTPGWLTRTRDVCFGTADTGLPDVGGWILLIGQPVGLLAILVAVWPQDLRLGLRHLTRSTGGQWVLGTSVAAMIAGGAAVVARISTAGAEVFDPRSVSDVAGQLTRIDDPAPRMSLVDQHGQAVSLDDFRGRPILVTFAFAHCETVCPTSVAEVLQAGAALVDRNPAVLIVTLDPWRDTPSRLGSIASAWQLTGDTRILSGSVDEVERVLNAWRIPRVRNERTGDVSHPSLVYVIDSRNRLAFAVGANAEAIAAAVRRAS